MRAVALATGLALWASSATAAVQTWTCDFVDRVSEGKTEPEPMRLIFKIDTTSQRAFMEGNAGIIEVGLHVGDAAFSLVEFAGSGAVQSTTITREGFAVHSRNTVILGEIVAAQHFGACRFDG